MYTYLNGLVYGERTSCPYSSGPTTENERGRLFHKRTSSKSRNRVKTYPVYRANGHREEKVKVHLNNPHARSLPRSSERCPYLYLNSWKYSVYTYLNGLVYGERTSCPYSSGPTTENERGRLFHKRTSSKSRNRVKTYPVYRANGHLVQVALLLWWS